MNRKRKLPKIKTSKSPKKYPTKTTLMRLRAPKMMILTMLMMKRSTQGTLMRDQMKEKDLQ
jgi:hypothetical protein